MTIDIAELDLLPETEPVTLADLDAEGLRPCYGQTCGNSCFWSCWITDW